MGEEQPKESGLRRLLKRRFILPLAIAAGAAIFFPNLIPRELEVRAILPKCADEVFVAAYQGDVLFRSHTQQIRGERAATHVFQLPAGDYRVEAAVSCGAQRAEVERKYHFEKDDELEFDLTKKCQC